MIQLHDLVSQVLARPPETRAISARGTWFTWGWMRAIADAVDASLREAGISEDAPVGIIPHNRPEFAAALLGLLAARRNIVMIYAYQSQQAKALRIAELRLPVVIAAEEDWGENMIAASRTNGATGLGLSADGSVKAIASLVFDPSIGHAGGQSDRGIAMLTSGTTGPPKHFHMPYTILQRAMIAESTLGGLERIADPDQNANLPPILHYFPFGNIAGLYSFLPMAAMNIPVILLEKFSLDAWLDYVRVYRPTVMGAPAAAYRMILEAKIPQEDLASIKHSATGATTLDPSVRAEFERTYPNIVITQSYGATEFAGPVVLMTLADRIEAGPDRADSIGRPYRGASIRIVDPETGDDLPRGQIGRIMVHAPRMGETWIATSDLGVMDADDFVFHHGRLDGAIMRGGFKIVPDVVAEALSSHPAIAVAAVVAIPHDRLGQVPAAAYEKRAGVDEPTAAELDAHLRERIPSTHLPSVYLRVDALPRTPSLKINSAEVRMLFDGPAS